MATGESMKVSEKIKDVKLEKEFRVCPSCGYEMGFHISFLRNKNTKDYKIVVLCPNCGARFDIGWELPTQLKVIK
jgi:transcription elongation factor Elf1